MTSLQPGRQGESLKNSWAILDSHLRNASFGILGLFTVEKDFVEKKRGYRETLTGNPSLTSAKQLANRYNIV
jgi:hypothetical protein